LTAFPRERLGHAVLNRAPHGPLTQSYRRSLQATLNDAVRRAADETGATYVDLSRVSDGHDACQPLGVRWVESVLQGTNPVIVHPNALGEAAMAARAMEVLRLR
jgi:hypothetical protein